MKHMIYPAALVLALSLGSCSNDDKDHRNEGEMNNVQGAPNTTETTVAPAETDNNAEREEYRAKIDAVIADVDAKIEHNKELKKDEKDKNKKEAYENQIKYLQELKDELKDHKDNFDDRAGKGWDDFKAKLNNTFDRNNSDDKNHDAH
jgi:hypothetical protein